MNKDIPLPYHVQYLQQELARRKLKNPRYSLRAFAAFLKLDSAALSRILNGKQDISLQACLAMITKLSLQEEEKRLFLASVAQERMNRAVQFLTKALHGNGESLLKSPPELRELTANPSGFTHSSESIVAQSADLFYVVDRQGRIVYTNPEGAKMFQAVPSELIGKTATECGVPPEVADLMNQQRRLVYESKKCLLAEVPYPTPDGVRHLERMITPVLGSDGEVEVVVCSVRDITDRKRSQDRLKQLLKLSEDLSVALTTEMVSNSVLDHAMSSTGANGGDIILIDPASGGLRLHALRGASQRLQQELEKITLAADSRFAHAIRRGDAILMDRLSPDDAEYPVFISLMRSEGVRSVASLPLRMDGKILGTLCLRFHEERGFNADEKAFLLTVANHCALALERTRLYCSKSDAADVLAGLLRKYERVLKQIPLGVAIAEAPTGRVILVSDEMKRILGHAGGETLTDQAHFAALRPDGRPLAPAEHPLARALERGETVTGEELLALRPDRAQVRVRCASHPVRDDAGKIVAATLTMSEVGG